METLTWEDYDKEKTVFDELITSNVEVIAYQLAMAYASGVIAASNEGLNDNQFNNILEKAYKIYLDTLNTKSNSYIGKVD